MNKLVSMNVSGSDECSYCTFNMTVLAHARLLKAHAQDHSNYAICRYLYRTFKDYLCSTRNSVFLLPFVDCCLIIVQDTFLYSVQSSWSPSGLDGAPEQWTWSLRLKSRFCGTPSGSTRTFFVWRGRSPTISTAWCRPNTPWGTPSQTWARSHRNCGSGSSDSTDVYV